MAETQTSSSSPARPVSMSPAPAKPATKLSDADQKRLDVLRAKAPAIAEPRTVDEEVEFLALERKEREALWAAQDERYAELVMKERTKQEDQELADLKVTIDGQKRAGVRG